MAYEFNGTSQFLSVPVNSAFEFGTGDFTVAAWVRTGASTFAGGLGDAVAILGPGPIGGANPSTCGWWLRLRGTDINWYRFDGVVETNQSRSLLFFANTLYHIAAARIGTSLGLYVNGTLQGAAFTDSVSYNRTDNSDFQVAKVTGGGGSGTIFLNGRVAELAIWKGYGLTADEIAALGKGVSPPAVRSRDLSFYAPLLRNLQDVRGGLTITNNNTATVADHPRIYL